MRIDYSVYLVTDRGLCSANTLESAVEQAVRGGCTLVQLREKELSSREFYEQAVKIKRVTDAAGIPLIINDRVDIALAAGAAGVHVGQSDLPARVVRGLLGKNKILGVSASTLAEAVAAESEGADYIGVGAMYATATKTDAVPVSREELKRITSSVGIPVVAIGGINEDTIPSLSGTHISGVAVVSAVIASPNIESAARRISCLVHREVRV